MDEESDSEFLKDSREEKEKKPEKKKENAYEVKFRVTPRAIERVISITIILVLLYFVFHFAFQEKFCKEVETIATTELITASAFFENETQAVEEEVIEETTIATEENETTESEVTTTTPKEKVIDAEILLDANDIETEGSYPSIKVTEVVYQIKNKGDTFRAKVELRWYDKDDDNIMKEMIRATDNPLVAEKQTVTKTLTEFSSKYLSSENDDEVFIIALYNNADDKLLDTARVTVYP